MEMYKFSLEYVDRILEKHGYTKLSENNTDKAEPSRCKIYFKANLIVQVYFKTGLLGHEVTNIAIVDNNFGLPGMYKRFLATSQDESALFKCVNIPLEKMLELAIGDTSTLNMRIENYITEEALERL
jgi:hypothetical protein